MAALTYLAGFYNQKAFGKAIKQIGGAKSFSLIFLDKNNFVTVNDIHGHSYEDAFIKEVAVLVLEEINKNYTCDCYGGDEFSII